VIVPEFVAPISDRVILLEELTGVRCPNCPAGSLKVEDLLQLFEGQIVAMAIHGDVLSEPLDESKYDFRSADAEELEHYLLPFWGKPAAAVNRIVSDGQQAFLNPDTWSGYIEAELAKEHVLDIQLSTTYDESTRALTVNMGIIPLKDMSGTFNISLAITESHIIDAQLNSTVVIPDFEHNHVFREMLTAVPGDFLASELTKNEVINKSFSFTLPTDDDLWVAENCHVIGFVSLNEENSKEVLQAAQAEVVH